jgi:ArsR family transcriptional regulator, lead/cadmium/zinc/bismuth-responsive transcriptional repressor
MVANGPLSAHKVKHLLECLNAMPRFGGAIDEGFAAVGRKARLESPLKEPRMKCVGPTLTPKQITYLREQLKFTPELDELAARLSIAGNATRLRIIFLLAELKEVCVCDIADILGVTMSAVSQHLAKFKAHGLVKTRRDAQTLYYSLTEHPFNETLKRTMLTGIEI